MNEHSDNHKLSINELSVLASKEVNEKQQERDNRLVALKEKLNKPISGDMTIVKCQCYECGRVYTSPMPIEFVDDSVDIWRKDGYVMLHCGCPIINKGEELKSKSKLIEHDVANDICATDANIALTSAMNNGWDESKWNRDWQKKLKDGG
jgi:carbamate kinase